MSPCQPFVNISKTYKSELVKSTSRTDIGLCCLQAKKMRICTFSRPFEDPGGKKLREELLRSIVIWHNDNVPVYIILRIFQICNV